MATLLYYGILLPIFSILFVIFSCLSNKNGVPRNWPLLGSTPGLIVHCYHLLDWAGKVVEHAGSTIILKGPWFSGTELIVTVDPANVQYTSNTKFSNFPRGSKSKEFFDVFGEGYFNLDSSDWSLHRRIFRAFFNHKQFLEYSTKLTLDKVEKGLVPVLDDIARKQDARGIIDLQDFFQRYTYDLTHWLVIGYDPNSLSTEWPEVPVSKALNVAMEAVFYRHFLPEGMWKLQRLLKIGKEKSLRKAKEVLDRFAAKHVSVKRDEFSMGNARAYSILSMYLTGDDEKSQWKVDDQALQGSLLSLMLAGKDTTGAALSWFFWLLKKHPSVESKIKEELRDTMPEENTEKWHLFTQEEVNNLVYLHAALCETLRLYPPVPFQTRSPLEPDILPTGHHVIPKKTMIVIPLYLMGRMTAIWGTDSQEFKPERWITEKGGIKHEPSHKFFTFNAGPRICMGRELAFTQMKAAAAAIIHNYNVRIVAGQMAQPLNSVILQVKDGLHASITKKWS
ncbi:hypothetical protein Ancab_006374 [Ancistrocladus abbreviatus]